MTTHAPSHEAATSPVRWLYLIGLVILYGSSFLLIKVGVATVPPLTLVAIRLGLGTLTLLAIAITMGLKLPRLSAASLRTRHGAWRWFALLGLTGNVLPFAFITWGQQAIPSSLAGILMAVMPLATMGLATLFVPGEKATMRALAGFVIGFIGLTVLFGPGALSALGGQAWLAQIAMLAGALCYATNAVLTKNMPATHPVIAAAGIHICATLAVAAAAFALEDPLAITPTAVSMMSILCLGVFQSALATLMLLALIQRAGPTFTAQINYLVPLWAVMMGYVFLGEDLGISALIALGLILAGIGLSQTRPTRKPTGEKA